MRTIACLVSASVVGREYDGSVSCVGASIAGELNLNGAPLAKNAPRDVPKNGIRDGVNAADEADPGLRMGVVMDHEPASLPQGDQTQPVREALIVVATFNRPGAIRNLLDDLTAQQSVAAFEVVIVNDGGKVDVPHEVRRDLPFRVRVVDQANAGPARARHCGIGMGSAPIVIVVDDDMRLGPTFVEAHLAAHKDGAEIVYGLIASSSTSGLDPLFTRFHDQHIDRWLEDCRNGATPRGDRLCTGNVSFRREAYEAIGGFDLSLTRLEDRDLGIRFEMAGYRFAFAANAVSTHNSDHSSVTTWRKRSRLYGVSELAITRKHPQRPELSPWSFLNVLPKIVHPLLIGVACLPASGRPLGAVAYGAGRVADRLGRSSVALRLAGLTYGIDYYSGAGREWGSPRVALADWKQWKAKRR